VAGVGVRRKPRQHSATQHRREVREGREEAAGAHAEPLANYTIALLHVGTVALRHFQ
jgi:hypothetical protein